MFSRMGSAAFKKDLTNIHILCERLGNPQEQFKTIHIGGTNGKGSTSHMLASVLQTAGYKTGLYTSPHLYDFRERIRIDGIMADEGFVVDFVKNIKPVLEEIEPSFFETTVAMAFTYFAHKKVDVAVIEVGLGGRLDSTNIIHPELAIITNIGWDHTNILGNTLEAIAGEKAGIIKNGVPVVIGERKEETEKIFIRTAEEKKAPIFFAEDYFQTNSFIWQNHKLILDVLDIKSKKVNSYQLDLPGIYQKKNIQTVLTAIELLQKKDFTISNSAVHEGLKKVVKNTGLHGRWEVIHEQPAVVLEVAHNKDGIQQMLEHLKNIRFKQLHMILGMVKDKDIMPVLELLPKDAHYYFTNAHIPRALDAASLKEQAAKAYLQGSAFDHVDEALANALNEASEDDLIIVCGSIFLVAEVNRDFSLATLEPRRHNSTKIHKEK